MDAARLKRENNKSFWEFVSEEKRNALLKHLDDSGANPAMCLKASKKVLLIWIKLFMKSRIDYSKIWTKGQDELILKAKEESSNLARSLQLRIWVDLLINNPEILGDKTNEEICNRSKNLQSGLASP